MICLLEVIAMFLAPFRKNKRLIGVLYQYGR